MATEIYLRGTTTYVKVTAENGTLISLNSSNKNRELQLTNRGVKILPDSDSYTLNNFEIVLDDLVNKFGATTPEELLSALGENNFFKKGGGGVSETELNDVLDDYILKSSKTDNENENSKEKVPTSFALSKVNNKVTNLENDKADKSTKIIIGDKNVNKFEVDIFSGERIKFENVLFNNAEKTLTPKLTFESNTYFIDAVNGDDSTGVIGFSSLPFKTFDACLLDITPDKSNFPIITVTTFKIMDNSTHYVNEVFPSRNNYVIKSDFFCTVSFKNNTNSFIYNSSSFIAIFNIEMPNGTLEFSSTRFQRIVSQSKMKIRLRKLISPFSANNNIFSLWDGFDIKIDYALLSSALINRGARVATFVKRIEINHLEINGNFAKISSGTDVDFADISINRITGTGNFILADTYSNVKVKDIDITGHLTLCISFTNSKIEFLNSTIKATSFKWGEIKILTLKGTINKDSTAKLSQTLAIQNNAILTFDNFKGNFEECLILDNVTINIKDSVIFYENIPFKFHQFVPDNLTLLVNFYGNNTINSQNPTALSQRYGSKVTDFVFNDYGTLKTNIKSLGQSTYNKLAEFDAFLPNYTDNADAISGGLNTGDEYYNTTTNTVATVS